jgi:1-aminocyclopropane-1-carboxylate deaminase
LTDLFVHPPHLLQEWESPEFRQAGIEVQIIRGDLFHPWIQGNKWYKLRHYAALAARESSNGFISMGGPWSNHLQAMAYYAAEKKLEAVFFIRGEEHEWENHPPVLQLRRFGAVLRPVSRSDFREITAGRKSLMALGQANSSLMEVPLGASSAETIPHTAAWAEHLQSRLDFTDLVLPVASGGTLAGMLAALPEEIRVHGIDVLNSKEGLKETVYDLLEKAGLPARAELHWHDQYHFGAYARNHPLLQAFIDKLRQEQQLPSEPVYSGKAFYAVLDLAAKGHFLRGSKVLILHTGGLFQWE